MIRLLKKIILCFSAFTFTISLSAQKTNINDGPVVAFTKRGVKPVKPLGKTRLFVSETVYLKKGDWLIGKVNCRNQPVSIDVYDRMAKKYVKTVEDTIDKSFYRSELYYQATREDSFDILFNTKKPIDDDDDYGWSVSEGDDTARFDYTVATFDPAWQPADTNWSFQQRLSYICNNWTAGFSAIPKTYDKVKAQKEKKITEYLPEVPIPVDDRMGVSLQVLGYGKQLVYFMFTPKEPYDKAKLLYDELFKKLKAVTDKTEISNLSELKRINELATTYFSLKVPVSKTPFEYSFVDPAGKGFNYLPINLFLFGDKKEAQVLVVLGEPSSDVYDIGW